jgi:di/tricarboxylate transporter
MGGVLTALQKNGFLSKVAQPPAARLFSPTVAAIGSVPFSLFFGVMAVQQNWSVLGRPDKAEEQSRWHTFAVLYQMVAVVGGNISPELFGREFLVGLSLGLVASWYFACVQDQDRYLEWLYGSSYLRESWFAYLGLWFSAVFQVVLLRSMLVAIPRLLGYNAE